MGKRKYKTTGPTDENVTKKKRPKSASKSPYQKSMATSTTDVTEDFYTTELKVRFESESSAPKRRKTVTADIEDIGNGLILFISGIVNFILNKNF